MFKILVSDALSEEGIKILKDNKKIELTINTKLTPEELLKEIPKYDVLLIRSGTRVTKEVINAAVNLKIIGRAGVGVDNVDTEAASKRGIIVMNTPEGNTISTAELTFSNLMAVARNIPQANSSLKSKKWERKQFTGVELKGKVLGVIGLGRIGFEVAKRAKSFEMKVTAYDPFISLEKAESAGIKLASLEEIYSSSDFITIHTPLTNQTKYLIDESALAKMKPEVRIINCARGGIIKESALYEALKNKKIAGAALDVFENEPPLESPLLDLDNCVVTPHLGASTTEAQENVAVDVIKQVLDALFENRIVNAINVPCVDPAVLKELTPYLSLAEKMGNFLGQMGEQHTRKIEIMYSGEIAKYDVKPITTAFIKGFLQPILKDTVNFVNAPFIAKDRDIKVIEQKTTEVEDFTNLISVKIETDKIKTFISGSLLDKKLPRIVKIDDYMVDIVPTGNLLICSNYDIPGIIGRLGTILGSHNINIAGMRYGRKEKGGSALSLYMVDTEIPSNVIKEIEKINGIEWVKTISL
ncbi:MAG: phosphoglycerate dehydrogenase [Candidatus Firestonebacteria bacterium]|nr:phosphoglycerate dehydrogenase [Candidatus Firestonebacteria bacterium]